MPHLVEWGVLPLVLNCFAKAVVASQPLPADLASAYEKTLKAYERASFTVNARTSITGYIKAPCIGSEEATYRIWRDGARWKCFTSRKTGLPVDGILRFERSQSEELFLKDRCTIVGLNPDQQRVTFILAWLDHLPQQERAKVGAFEGGVALTGYMSWNGSLLLPDILKESTLSSRKETLQGRAIWLLEATSPWGYHALSLDPSLGFLPRRIHQHKRSDQWFEHGKLIGTLEGDGDFYPRSGYRDILQTIEVDRIDHIGDQAVMTALSITEELRFANGRSVLMTSRVRFSDVDLNPNYSREDPFRIATAIPNGTPVQVNDYPTLTYEWVDGKIVKSINEEAVAKRGGYAFTEGAWLKPRALILVGSCAGMALVVLWYRRKG